MSHPPRFEKPWKSIYIAARIALWSVFLLSMSAFALSLLFPSQELFYTFSASKAQGNLLVRPRTSENELRGDGRFNADETFLVDASALGDFSHVIVSFSNTDSTDTLSGSSISVRRSQQAFFYPEGAPAAFPEGTLLRYEGDFFQISPSGMRRKFDSEGTARALGFSTDSFLMVSSEELLANPEGDIISSRDTLPEGTFIHSNDTYYEWKDNMLVPFVSAAAFLERFPAEWAISKDTLFIQNHTVSESWMSYPSGSLLAWGDGVFLMDGVSPRPILGADIFLSLGYSWEDVHPASDEEISLTEKGKFVDVRTPHPDGSVLLDTKEQRYFLIQNGEKHEIKGEALLRMWIGNRHPIRVSSDAFTEVSSCVLTMHSKWFSADQTKCSLSLEKFPVLFGDTYEFSLHIPRKTDIARMDVSFDRTLEGKTLRSTLSKLKSRILSRYISTP